MKLAIVVGHSKDKKGAYAVGPINQHEYDFNIEVAQNAYQAAMLSGIQTKIFLRDSIGIVGAYKEVNKWADENTVCIELHFNSFNGKAQGTETLFDKDPVESIEVAREVHEAVCALFDRRGKLDRGLKLIDDGRGAKSLAECKVPGCLIEPFFGDNKNDAILANSLRLEYAKTIVFGVLSYFENKIKRISLN